MPEKTRQNHTQKKVNMPGTPHGTHQLVSTVIAKSTVRVAVHDEGGVKGKGEEDTSSTQHALSPENIGMEGI